MKFVEQFKYTTLHFVTEENIEYRTSTSGEYWERSYGNSWEAVYLDEEDECKKAFAALADVVIAAS